VVYIRWRFLRAYAYAHGWRMGSGPGSDSTGGLRSAGLVRSGPVFFLALRNKDSGVGMRRGVLEMTG
jgi:hypothetical protein